MPSGVGFVPGVPLVELASMLVIVGRVHGFLEDTPREAVSLVVLAFAASDFDVMCQTPI